MTENERLEAIEQIQRLKARYFRCMDTKDWALYDTCHAPDVTVDSFQGQPAQHRDEAPECLAVAILAVIQRRDVPLRDHQQVDRRRRMDVMEGEQVLVLVHDHERRGFGLQTRRTPRRDRQRDRVTDLESRRRLADAPVQQHATVVDQLLEAITTEPDPGLRQPPVQTRSRARLRHLQLQRSIHGRPRRARPR